MLRIKTRLKTFQITTLYSEFIDTWLTMCSDTSVLPTMEANSLLEAGQNHLRMCRTLQGLLKYQ